MTGSVMDCAEIRNTLLGGTVPSGPAVEAHVRECAPCSELLRDHAALGRQLSENAPPETRDRPARGPTDGQSASGLWASVEGAISAESGPRAWLRSRSTPVRVLLAATVGAGIVAVGGQSADAFVPGAQAVAWLILFSLAGLACLWALVAPLGRARPTDRTRVALVWLALSLPLVVAVLSSSPGEPATGDRDFAEQAFACFAYGSLLALPFVIVVWTLDRSERARLVLLTGLAGVAGLVANGALALHCSNTAPLHLAAGHATIGSALAGIGVLIASFSTARRKSGS